MTIPEAMEREILDIVGPLNLPITEKMKRVKRTLDLVTSLCGKYGEVGVREVYNVLYFEEDKDV